MKYDPQKHHRRSIRLKGYDYTQPGAYFITMCAYQPMHMFDEVANGEMILNDTGRIVRDEWFKTAKLRPYVELYEDEFVESFHADNRFERTSTWSPSEQAGRWRAFTYEELLARDKVNLDIFWLRDESLEDSANLPDPDVLAAEIVEDLRSALTQFEGIAEELGGEE